MEEKVAIIGIFITDNAAASKVNALLHEYGASIIGRMGLPHYRESCSIITIVMDSTIDTINALCGKLGRLKHVQVKSMMAK